MYSLIIVDDESYVRQAIIKTIEWEELGFCVIGEAQNGKDGLSLAKKLKPDLVITDIKMPFMDGIEMIDLLKSSNPTIKTVLLTGFDDFDYAKSAIRLNVLEYLLKPISASKMTKTLKGIKQQLDKESERLRDIEYIKENYNLNRPIMRMGFLHAFIMGKTKPEDAKRSIDSLDLNLQGDSNLVFVIKPNKHDIHQSSIGGLDSQLIMSTIENLSSSIASKYFKSETFWYIDYIIVIISDEKDKIINSSQTLILEIQQSLERIYSISSIIGISEIFNDINQISYIFLQTSSVLDSGVLFNKSEIIHVTDIEPNNIQFILQESEQEKLVSIIKIGKKQDATYFIQYIFNKMTTSKISLSDFHLCVMEMFSIVVRTTKRIVPNFDLNVLNNLDFMNNFFRHESIDEVCEWFERICHRMIEYVSLSRQDNTKMLVDSCVEYIKNNYQNSGISLKTLSEHVHFSQSYLSAIFKKFLNDSFTNILVRTRMEKAKEEVLYSNKKILQIACDTGFSDQHYFSYCYKKFFGVSPNEMRQEKNNLESSEVIAEKHDI